MPDSAKPPRQRARVRLLFALPWIGLASVAVALAAGVPWPRVRVLGGELAASCLAGVSTIWIERRKRSRARRELDFDPPPGVRLKAPMWMRLDATAVAIEIGGLVAALPALFGLSSISIGVFLTFAAITFLPGASPEGLTFEDDGLRTHDGAGSTLIAWDSIRAVRVEGPDHLRWVFLDLMDGQPVLILPWAGGVDGLALARAIDRARRGATPALN